MDEIAVSLRDLRGFPDGDGLTEPVPIVDGVDDRCAANTERVNDSHGNQTVDTDTGLFIDAEDFLLTVDVIGAVAGFAVVIDEEAVQPSSEHEDVTRLCDVQAPRSLLATGESGILPLRKGSV